MGLSSLRTPRRVLQEDLLRTWKLFSATRSVAATMGADLLTEPLLHNPQLHVQVAESPSVRQRLVLAEITRVGDLLDYDQRDWRKNRTPYTVVIMNRSEYEQEAARQLSNTSFYKPLPYDPTESYQKQLQHLLKKLPEKAQDQIRTDTPLEPRPGIFYLLPKIHKPGTPGRPIISGIGTLTAGLS
ncbi:unnamed protein product, partial [Eretmochelys imbricata]